MGKPGLHLIIIYARAGTSGAEGAEGSRRERYSTKLREDRKKPYSRRRGGNYSGRAADGRKRRKGRERMPPGPGGNPKGPHPEGRTGRTTAPSGPFRKAGKPEPEGMTRGKRKRGSEYTLPPAMQR